MTNKRKAQAGDAWAQQKNILQKNNNKRPPVMQPGTALPVSLVQFKSGLLLLPYTQHISSLVDCCDFLLDELERRKS